MSSSSYVCYNQWAVQQNLNSDEKEFYKGFFYEIVESKQNNPFIPHECKNMNELDSIAKMCNRGIQNIQEAHQMICFEEKMNPETFMKNNEFLNKSKQNEDPHSKTVSTAPNSKHQPYKAILNYLTEWNSHITTPITQSTAEIDDNSDDDTDNEADDEVKPNFQKYDLDNILDRFVEVHKYMSADEFENYRQIDMIFIQEDLDQKDINKIKQNTDGLWRKIHPDNVRSRENTQCFSSKCVMLIIEDNKHSKTKNDKLYMFELKNKNKNPVPYDVLQYTEMPMILNTIHNPPWLESIVKKNNCLTISYHRHAGNITRVYAYKIFSDQYHTRTPESMRVFPENMIDVLKVFCDSSDAHDYSHQTNKLTQVQFNDPIFSSFFEKHFKKNTKLHNLMKLQPANPEHSKPLIGRKVDDVNKQKNNNMKNGSKSSNQSDGETVVVKMALINKESEEECITSYEYQQEISETRTRAWTWKNVVNSGIDTNDATSFFSSFFSTLSMYGGMHFGIEAYGEPCGFVETILESIAAGMILLVHMAWLITKKKSKTEMTYHLLIICFEMLCISTDPFTCWIDKKTKFLRWIFNIYSVIACVAMIIWVGLKLKNLEKEFGKTIKNK